MTSNTPFPFGSVSSGTLIQADLIAAFSAALESLDPDCELVARAQEYDAESDDTEKGEFLLEELFEALDDLTPPFCSFRASPDDGADFGFWPEYDLIREAIDGGDLLQVSDIREIPMDYDGQALRVRDGYMTLFAVIDGAAYEVWTTYAPDPE